MIHKEIIAVDAGSKNIKIIYAVKTLSRIDILKASIAEIPPLSINSGYIYDKKLVADVINGFMKNHGIRAKSICFVISGADLIVKHIEVPIMRYDYITKNVCWEMEKYIKKEPEEYYVDYEIQRKILTNEKKVYEILAGIVLRKKIENYIEIAEMLEMELDSIDVFSNCMARVISFLNPERKQAEGAAIVDFGHQSVKMAFINKGVLYESKERSINSCGLKYENIDKQLFCIQKILKFYIKNNQADSVLKVYAAGGGSKKDGVIEKIADIIKMPVYSLNTDNNSVKNVRFHESIDMDIFINNIGLLLRKD